jgi:hypothetical protein
MGKYKLTTGRRPVLMQEKLEEGFIKEHIKLPKQWA